MIKAILLDLDNTLLENPQDVFIPAYLRALNAYAEDDGKLTSALLSSVRNLNTPRNFRRTNGAFVLDFVSRELGHSTDDLLRLLDEFYGSAYQTLQSITTRVPYAFDLIQQLREQFFSVVIATNPIYPADAIRQRLSWAGVSDEFTDYALVTHGDNMHFSKPDLAYYAEILARVGIEPDEALMVGDSLDSDILPAAAVGLHTYHIKTNADAKGDGTLADFFSLICTEEWTNHFTRKRLDATMIEPELRGNLAALFGMLSEVKSHYWHQHPDPNEWSIVQIVCHLLESETDVQRPRLQRILNEENPFLVAPKAPVGAEAVPCGEEGFSIADQFVEARYDTLHLLNNLRSEDWQRPARHSIFGPTTLLEMAHFTAQHDRLHLNQLCRTLGKCE